MSNPLSNVPPPAALPSFVAAPLPPPASEAVAPPAGTSAAVTSAAPPAASSAPPAAGSLPPPPAASAMPPPPVGVAPPTGSTHPPPLRTIPTGMLALNESVPPLPSLQPAGTVPVPPVGGPPPTAGPPPPPPTGTGHHVPLSYAGHISRPRYVAPPELPTTGGAGPAPLYQTGAVTGAPPMPDSQLGGVSVMPMSSAGGATVDYAQTPYSYAGAADPAGGGGAHGEGWLGWIKDTVQKSEVLSKVAERARTSMDSMITTLDPQMRDIIYSGGDLDIVVASDKEVKVSAVREAFQLVFGKATVQGVPSPGPCLVPQPVGWQGARAAAEARVQSLRSSGLVPAQQAIVAAEGFIVQLQPERWFDMTLLLLDEPAGSALSVFTQPTEVPEAWVQRMEGSTPPDHPQRWAGLQLTVGQVASETLQVAPSAWHEVTCGLTRRELLLPAARSLAHQFRTRRGS
ncbi:protein PRRC1-like isoform X2 [Amphibalanus amphitrite]|uniref:protein PRRC1-like isoform X2 n=1 Tax=Amphibalanus amphitrite TaxID=1232801 RepID=UPI001C9282A0|nr:protein PRRC1-like isoform X2 [Amphibalanus amphitrite]XP_043197866.1 protein PRRC1-like isoform X2 [Amphibalanus amphitrite]XP_043197867.1 protein PRRC1-like isoform X2 [Amphibalanus amphitrite]